MEGQHKIDAKPFSVPTRGRGRPTVALLAILVVADPEPDGVILPPRDITASVPPRNAAPDTWAAPPTAQFAARMLGQLVTGSEFYLLPILPPHITPTMSSSNTQNIPAPLRILSPPHICTTHHHTAPPAPHSSPHSRDTPHRGYFKRRD